MSIVMFDGPPSWSLDASGTGGLSDSIIDIYDLTEKYGTVKSLSSSLLQKCTVYDISLGVDHSTFEGCVYHLGQAPFHALGNVFSGLV